MKIRSPIVTLLVGAGLAGVLLVLDARASSDAQDRAAAAAATATVTASSTPTSSSTTTPSVTSSAPSAPAATTAPVATKPVTYAGHLNGTGSVAVVVRGEKAVAYMCDSQNRVEAWMQGSATNGKVNLSGRQSAQLTGTVTGTRRPALKVQGCADSR
jgi:serine/threonine-protein kinase